MYREQDARWRVRWLRDAIIAVIWGLVVGFGTLALTLSLEAGGGDRITVALGKQLWGFVGIAWGFGIWWFRRMAASER
jgi:hypothetical protein